MPYGKLIGLLFYLSKLEIYTTERHFYDGTVIKMKAGRGFTIRASEGRGAPTPYTILHPKKQTLALASM